MLTMCGVAELVTVRGTKRSLVCENPRFILYQSDRVNSREEILKNTRLVLRHVPVRFRKTHLSWQHFRFCVLLLHYSKISCYFFVTQGTLGDFKKRQYEKASKKIEMVVANTNSRNVSSSRMERNVCMNNMKSPGNLFTARTAK